MSLHILNVVSAKGAKYLNSQNSNGQGSSQSPLQDDEEETQVDGPDGLPH